MLRETGDAFVCILKKARRSVLAKGRASYQLCSKYFAGNQTCRNDLVFTKHRGREGLSEFPKFPFLPHLFHSIICSWPLPWEIKHLSSSAAKGFAKLPQGWLRVSPICSLFTPWTPARFVLSHSGEGEALSSGCPCNIKGPRDIPCSLHKLLPDGTAEFAHFHLLHPLIFLHYISM